MGKSLKDVSVGIVITAILCIGLGIILVVYPEMSTTLICYSFGGILVMCALFHIFFYIKLRKENNFVNFNLIIAVITGVIGVWILLKPAMVVLIIPIIFGIVLIIHGIIDFMQAFRLKEKYYNNWWVAIILAAINFCFAIILLINPFSAVIWLIRIIGIILIYDGASDVWIISRIGRATKDIKKSLETINKE